MAALEALLQTRCTPELRAQAEIAASECDLTLGEWIRAVVEGAVQVHFADESDTEDTAIEDPADDPKEYIARVEAAAKAARAADHETPGTAPTVIHPGLHEEPPPTKSAPLDPKDCPHLPSWRLGTICRCGTNVGGGGRTGAPRGRIPARVGLLR